jgi:DNA-binding transcriptional MerR regulator
MDIAEQKSLFRFMLKRMREYHHEMVAHRALVIHLKELGVPGVDDLLKKYRQAEEIQAVTNKVFSDFDELIEQLDEAAQGQALRKLLEQYKPDGEPN